MTIGDTLFETLLQFEGTEYRVGNSRLSIYKVQQDHLVLYREDGCFFIIPITEVKYFKTNAAGDALEWIIFQDNKQIPGGTVAG